MIGSLAGIVDEVHDDHITLDVNNIGYIVYVSSKLLTLCSVGDRIKLLIETQSNSRENTNQLYGFFTKEEQQCVRMLIKVNGVSYKTAIHILGKLTPTQLFSAILHEDKIALSLGGIGSKLASRIINELHSTIDKLGVGNDNSCKVKEDAIFALINLGYDKVRAYNVVKKVQNDSPEFDTKDIIMASLKDLSTL